MKITVSELTTKPKIDVIHDSTYVYLDWDWESYGFGQLWLIKDKETGIVKCRNEGMSRQAVRKILHAFADHMADIAIMNDERSSDVKQYKDYGDD